MLSSENVFEYIGLNTPKFRCLCKLAVNLRSQGWCIRRGFNYGADFLLYDSNPDSVHSRYKI